MPLIKEYRDKPKTLSQFSQYPATNKLKQLAQHPFDLTEEHLTPERISHFCARSCGIKLLYGTERITEEVLQCLLELTHQAKAFEKMEKMQAGEIMNVIDHYASENRPVLHTATRDFFDHPRQEKVAKDAAKLAKNETEKLKTFIHKIDREKQFTDLIMVAIGGSDLGPKANYLALQYLRKPERKIHFISNVDPDESTSILQHVNLKKSLVVVISKSGTTLETLVNEELLRQRFHKEHLKPEQHFVAVTSEGSPMDDPSRYLECFHMWDWVGGRFSTTSMAGGVMLSFAFGFDVYWEFLKGAHAMDRASLSHNLDQNLPLLGALLSIWNHNFLEFPTVAMIPYSQALARYPAHIQQVDMESNGKSIDKQGNFVDFQTGPIIWGEPGTNAQHSFFQLIHQGTPIVPLEFIGFKECQFHEEGHYKGTTSQQKLLSNLFAQIIALATGQKNENPSKLFPGNRPSHLLLAQKLDPYTLGGLLAYFEHKVAFQGFIWGINSFDQEGVQLGKILANKLINTFAAQNGHGKAEKFPLGEAFLKQLDQF